MGLIGSNGAGKSTLFRLIAGDLASDGGNLSAPPRERIGYLSQSIPDSDESLIEFVLKADSERANLLAQEAATTDGHEIGLIHDRLSAIGAYDAPARAAEILAGLGFNEAEQQQPVNTYSGGFRMRAALAGVLFARPDILLLDEPTNHLDMESTIWLENFLKKQTCGLLLISHDRRLLDSLPQKILHLENGTTTLYGGNYTRFAKERAAKALANERARSKQEERRAHLQAFVDRFRAKNTKAKQAQSRIKMLEKMEVLPPVSTVSHVNLSLPTPGKLSPPILQLEKAAAGYTEKPVLKNVSLRIDMDDRIAILGANGNGKSTLAKMLAASLPLMDGNRVGHKKLRIGFFTQHQHETLNEDGTPFSHLAIKKPDASPQDIRDHLGRFGFSGDRGDQTIATLSGGEKTRLLFALLFLDKPHLLILDEPTNHLDMDTRDSLLDALNSFEGAVILIAHDFHLLQHVADRFLLVEKGTVAPFEDDLDAYERYILSQRRGKEAGSAKAEKKPDGKKEQRQKAAEQRQQTAPLRKKIAALEKEIAKLEKEEAGLEKQLADPALYEPGAPAGKVTTLNTSLADLRQKRESKEEEWMEASEELDNFSAE